MPNLQEFSLRKIVYDFEVEEGATSVQVMEYSDEFLDHILEKINKYFQEEALENE